MSNRKFFEEFAENNQRFWKKEVIRWERKSILEYKKIEENG